MGIGKARPIKEQIFNSKGSIFIMHIIFLSQVGKYQLCVNFIRLWSSKYLERRPLSPDLKFQCWYLAVYIPMTILIQIMIGVGLVWFQILCVGELILRESLISTDLEKVMQQTIFNSKNKFLKKLESQFNVFFTSNSRVVVLQASCLACISLLFGAIFYSFFVTFDLSFDWKQTTNMTFSRLSSNRIFSSSDTKKGMLRNAFCKFIFH